MIKKFYAVDYDVPRIETRLVERETDKMVYRAYAFGKAIAEKKRCDDRAYFGTFDEARDWLLARHEANVIRARNSLERANGLLGNVKGMKEPQS